MELTEKQKRFVKEYIDTGNAAEAARRAGYSKRTAPWIAQQNLQKLTIRNAIDAKLKEIESKRTADMKAVMEYLTAVMRGESTVKVMKNGKAVELPPMHKDRLRAAELLMRRYMAVPAELLVKRQELEIEKLRADIQGAQTPEDDGFVAALKRSGKDVWNESGGTDETDHTV